MRVRDSVFARLEGPAIVNDMPEALFDLRYSALDRVGDPDVVGIGNEVEVLRGDDARCIDDFADDGRLLPESACVDGGTPGADCALEPGGEDACRLDMGHFGNTASAQ